MRTPDRLLGLLFAVTFVVIFALGCVSYSPSVAITSPASGATISNRSVTVTIQVSNFNIVDKQGQANVAGEGHVHYYLDVSPIPSTAGQPAIPTNASTIWAHVSGTTYTFTNVTPGTHTIVVQLVNNDHTPIIPLVTNTVTVTVSGTEPTPTTTVSPTTTVPTTTTVSPTTTVPTTTTVSPTTTVPTTTTVPSGGGY